MENDRTFFASWPLQIRPGAPLIQLWFGNFFEPWLSDRVWMAATLATPEWMTPLPMPTVGRTDPKWECGTMGFLPEPPKHIDHLGQANNFWRGDVWPPTSYHVAAGLQRYGYHDLAARICDATIMNALRWGDVNERYCCDTGKPLGVPDYGMST
jgi:glycogen debranching enzyme